jgi:hypothetical protein
MSTAPISTSSLKKTITCTCPSKGTGVSKWAIDFLVDDSIPLTRAEFNRLVRQLTFDYKVYITEYQRRMRIKAAKLAKVPASA